MRRLSLIILAALLVAGLLYSYGPWSPSENNETLDATSPAVKVAPTPELKAPDPVTVKVVEPEVEAIADNIPKKDRTFMLPDGTLQPVLNQAYGAPKMIWPRDLPYSRIVRIVRDGKGYDWYEHEDGSMSITQMAFRTDLGRMEAVTNVFNPTKALPMDNQAETNKAKAPKK